MTESSDSVDVRMSPSRLPISWRTVAIPLATILLISGVNLGLGSFASNFPKLDRMLRAALGLEH